MHRIHHLILFKNLLRGLTVICSILLVQFVAIGCEDLNNSKYNPPADHTISKEGAMHKSGLDQPMDNCVACHGETLEGGTSQVSCFECHGQKW